MYALQVNCAFCGAACMALKQQFEWLSLEPKHQVCLLGAGQGRVQGRAGRSV